MQPSRAKSYTLVVVQFVCLFAIVLTGPLFAHNPFWLFMELAALALALWALVAVRIDNVHVLPDVRPGSHLVRSGPYRWIRHPMYASLLLGALALVIDAPSWWRAGLWGVLLIDLVIKLHYEEQILAGHFADYTAYMQTSKRLIPYVY